ncbi:MAG: site-specific integrase [Silvibacterium sp.]
MQQAVQPTLKGVYQLRYWDGKLVYETLKALDPIAVMIEADILRKKIAARLNPSGQGSVKKKSIGGSIAQYIVELRRDDKGPTAKQLEYVMKTFVTSQNLSLPVNMITGQDVIEWHRRLKASGSKERTVKNRHVLLKMWLKWAGFDTSRLPDAPKAPKPLLAVVEEPEMQKMLAWTRENDFYCYVLIRLFSETGMRKQECANSRFDWVHGNVLKIQEDTQSGFTTKTRVEREVAISSSLVGLLQEWQTKRPWAKLIFETRNHKTPQSLINRVKRAAERAGLNPAMWSLHMLRRYFITTMLHRGVDIKTVSKMAGHSSISVTDLYARSQRALTMADTMNRVWADR